jgi:hypothetical protein
MILSFLLVSVAANAQELLPPHATLPSGESCAAKVSARPEIRPQNRLYNLTVPTATELAPFYSKPLQFNGPPASDFFRVDGNFKGTTDEIIQWAACKWGMDVTQLRAQGWAESGWNQAVKGDDEFEHSQCTGGNGFDAWQPSGYCYTSYSAIQIKCTNYNACPMAYESTPFAFDFRGAYWRACMEGHIKYYADSKPEPGYPTYPNGTAQQMSDGCMGSWYSGNWYDSSALPYIDRVHGYMQSKPWQPPFRFTAPAQNQTVSGNVTVKIVWPNTPGQCFYACLDSDMGFVTCVPGQGPWTWNTTSRVPNGSHILTARAYTCGMPIPAGNDLPIGWPDANLTVNVQNSAASVTKVSAHKRKRFEPHQQQQRRWKS